MRKVRSKISIFLGILSYVISLVPAARIKPYGNINILDKFLIPGILWCFCIILLIAVKNTSLKKYWWVWFSGFILFAPYFLLSWMFYCWDKHGFAP